MIASASAVDIQASTPREDSPEAISFGTFCLLPSERALLRASERVHIGSRALDILVELASHPGETVSAADLMRAVWPGLVVGDNTLRVHISALRKVLGDSRDKGRYIANRNGRGYAFVAPVTMGTITLNAAPQPKLARPPTRRGRLVGRSEDVKALLAHLLEDRLVTITGPGGIGKTVVALEVAHMSSGRFPMERCSSTLPRSRSLRQSSV
jgi:DNA-binding winged helix-turn-helix (wHTH) protein